MSLYEQISNDLLAGFYVEIKKKIQKEILSEAMYHEITLIREVAEKRNLSERDLERIYEEYINL
ncbi:hypothetical protein P9Y62_06225 [Bacillus thuringiensis]|uniref:Uncharacterized protein n=1 Tax=Bacillus thuringiensis HD-771 TaxID=1218175 RepID=A0A9W3NXY5_BACTU|nr:hypothetical protein [Bacillus thuringiensis]EEM37882.1 hypothetical protein bthur0004_62850 [Bacillus thuringiensis serovar sotto str. T04001]AFQ16450.1 hypothetical protein BTG_15000 [Bacillus thuringiensis HD-771]AFQ18757.1 hypothetical protein BTG_26790 [Bacillus thuringiensis HD-771]MEB4893617.1 hypothetical protein [Bacillus thuringiensis]MEC2564120.1 hypothetical protein [Bacillus thuringiensis]